VAMMNLFVINFGPLDASSGPDLIQMSLFYFNLFFHFFSLFSTPFLAFSSFFYS